MARMVCLLVKIRLILFGITESEPPSSKGQVFIKIMRGLFAGKPFFTLATIFVVFGLFIAPANAGILSFIGNLLGFNNDGPEIVYKNSQNVALLQAALNADPNPSKGGGEINIVGGSALVPDSGPLGTLADKEVSATPEQISVYVVREGDSLSQIAKMFSVSVDTIIWANDIRRGDLIQSGQTLVILPVSGVQHEVKKGDTLSSIAKKYETKVEEIISFNDMDDGYALVIGETVVIPGGKLATSYSSASAGTVVRGAGGPTYSGYYLRPISGGRKSQGLHGYNAVDLASYTGSPIYASAGGDVLISRTGWNGGYGNYIVIQHDNGTQTLYAHNSTNIVYSGQAVVQGQVIGYVGSTGRSTGSHVHYEVRGAQNPF